MPDTTTLRRAVQRFDEADTALKDFMEEHEDIFRDFYRLVEERNSACEKARTRVRSDRSNYGVFKHSIRKQPVFDLDALKDKLPTRLFKRVTKLSADRDAIENLLEREEISQEDLAGTYKIKEVVNCHGPKAWSIK